MDERPAAIMNPDIFGRHFPEIYNRRLHGEPNGAHEKTGACDSVWVVIIMWSDVHGYAPINALFIGFALITG